MKQIGARAAGDAAFWRARAERIMGHALRYRQYAGDLRDGLRAVGETADIHRKRAERAEALLREALTLGNRHYEPWARWEAKVRDLLGGRE